MYDRLIIFYFTGTGNALAAANWIGHIAENKGIPAKKIKITPALEVSKSDFSEKTLIGFCYPTHGFNAPPLVVNFCLRFPKLKNNVFIVNTRAGMKMSKLFTPGISGLAQLLPALILRMKGLRAIGFQPMDLPSNWISVHPGVNARVVDSIFKRCETKTKQFAIKTLHGGKTYKGLFSLPIDLLLSPISILYYFLGRFLLAKSFIADSSCNNCGLCMKECPVKAIVWQHRRPFWKAKCESCMHCMNVCPERAIQTPLLFTLVIWWLAFSVLPLFLLKELVRISPVLSEYFDLLFNFFVIITGIPIVFFAYRILHFLMKFRFFSWLITYTSLTKYKFWRRYSAPKRYR